MNVTELIEFLEDQDFSYMLDKDALLKRYPPLKYGVYRPQVANEPDGYPCMIREEAVRDNPYGGDDVYLSTVVLPEE